MSCRVVAIEHLTLDGVFQAPARSDEDRRDNFEYGGWSLRGDAPETQTAISQYMADGWSLLVGRTTYEDLYEGWHIRQPSSPMTQVLAKVQKFVASRSANVELPWENSTRLEGDATDAVAKLKREHDKTLVMFGSGALLRDLMRHHVVDELLLIIHPIVLGKGLRLFQDAPFSEFALAAQSATTTGVMIATYQSTSP